MPNGSQLTRVRWCGNSQCVLVKGWKSSASWGFPKGKINDEEEKWQCAVREASLTA